MSYIIGLNARNFTEKHFPESIILNYYNCLLLWCRLVKKSTHKFKLIFYSFCDEEYQSDLLAYKKLIADLKTDSIHIEKYSYYKLSDLRSGIGRCDLFIGTRFHSILMAIQQCVPTLALSYEKKGYNFMKQVGLEKYALKIEELTFDSMRIKWEQLLDKKQSIKENLKIINSQQNRLAIRHFDLITHELNQKNPKA